jgi:hypothetical protein
MLMCCISVMPGNSSHYFEKKLPVLWYKSYS